LPFGCGGDDDDEVQSAQLPACASIAVTAFLPERIEQAPARIAGVASTADHRAIQSLLIGPIPASADGFNFSRWSATLDRDALVGLPLAGDELARHVLPIRAVDHHGVVCAPQGGERDVTIELPDVTPETQRPDAGPLDGG
jgi:hypothetical protein